MARAAQGGGPLDTRMELSPESVRTLVRLAKEAGPEINKEIRAGLRGAGDSTAQKARDAVTGTAPAKADQRTKTQKVLRFKAKVSTNRKTGNGSLRASIAKGVKVSIRAGKKDAGIRISSTDSTLPGNKKAMNRVYRLQVFRHPVFGGPGWANQHGKDWFYAPIKANKKVFETAVQAAMQSAANKLQGS
ncbi:hypothetical protein MB46_10400 [Arthrobacter alpinus]|uniref:hypothetical protein n=1 Tax=Arthrobacter alpinus TaxID=656366 RepID=UPI0005CA248E|nr:hypothetical protein [Arthrobacter alpinus]ALV45831.1 hypothetical protein MB46_10400 [Arthrobacter alpinus]